MVRKTRGKITDNIVDIIIKMARENEKFKKISEVVNLDRKTITKILKNYEKGERFISASEKYKSTMSNKKNNMSVVEQLIFNAVACDNSLVIKEMQDKIFNQLNLRISKSTIARKLLNLNISRKRLNLIPKERNTKNRLDERAIYAADISRFADEQLVFLDETGFNQHTCRTYGYSVVNTPAFINVPANRGINRSVMCAISKNGIVAFEIRTGAFNSNFFVDYIETKLAPYFHANPRKILILDNARIHKTEEVESALRRNGIVFKFTTPYSPELNPIEEFFSMIKSKYQSFKLRNPEISLENCVSQILSTENNYSSQCQNFYKNMRIWLEKARRREPFI